MSSTSSLGSIFNAVFVGGGFAGLRCAECGAEKLFALSCKTRAFCPSCGAKRALLWAEFVHEKVLKNVPHRYVVFTLPNSQEMVDKIRAWKHTGFDAWIGPPISEVREIVQIGMYTVWSPASSGRLVLDHEPKLRYYAKGTQPDRDIGGLFGPESRTFDYLDWIARFTSHIPDRGCQMAHYFGAYSSAHRGKEAREKSASRSGDSPAPAPIELEEDWIKARPKSWARLIQQVYEVDPLLCECRAKL